MSEGDLTFVTMCLSRDALAEDIEDHVERWHEGDSPQSLATYLGFTGREYAVWVEKPSTLNLILYARKMGLRLDDVNTADQAYRLAARSLSEDEGEELVEWLRMTGRISG
jgi:hypothetical protein